MSRQVNTSNVVRGCSNKPEPSAPPRSEIYSILNPPQVNQNRSQISASIYPTIELADSRGGVFPTPEIYPIASTSFYVLARQPVKLNQSSASSGGDRVQQQPISLIESPRGNIPITLVDDLAYRYSFAELGSIKIDFKYRHPCCTLNLSSEHQYDAYDCSDKVVFKLEERQDFICKNTCSCGESFQISVKDPCSREILRIDRELNLSFCGWMKSSRFMVSTPSRQLVGVLYRVADTRFRIKVKDSFDRKVLEITGRNFFEPASMLDTNTVCSIKTSDGRDVGTIVCHHLGLGQDLLTVRKALSVTFDTTLDADIKALCFAAMLYVVSIHYS